MYAGKVVTITGIEGCCKEFFGPGTVMGKKAVVDDYGLSHTELEGYYTGSLLVDELGFMYFHYVKVELQEPLADNIVVGEE